MFDFITQDLLSIIIFLIPGFLAAWIFYGLTSHPKPSQFERSIQALVFTFIIQLLVFPVELALTELGNFYVIRPWDAFSENLASIVIAFLLGLLLAYFTNNDQLHKKLRKKGFTTRTSHPSEWFYVFSEKVTFVILHLVDGRRLYGWPKEWPIESNKGQFYIMLPSWIIDDGTEQEAPELDGILISASDVRWVEFIKMSGEENEQ